MQPDLIHADGAVEPRPCPYDIPDVEAGDEIVEWTEQSGLPDLDMFYAIADGLTVFQADDARRLPPAPVRRIIPVPTAQPSSGEIVVYHPGLAELVVRPTFEAEETYRRTALLAHLRQQPPPAPLRRRSAGRVEERTGPVGT